ncbi:MAG: hypothetical protein AB2417_15090 [Clostridiaceae bacterium]
MNYLFYEKETDTKGRVVLIYSVTPPQELLSQPHILMEIIPTSDNIVGKSSLPYINPQTGEFWYEYIDRPLTPEEIANQKVSELESMIADIIGGAV